MAVPHRAIGPLDS